MQRIKYSSQIMMQLFNIIIVSQDFIALFN